MLAQYGASSSHRPLDLMFLAVKDSILDKVNKKNRGGMVAWLTTLRPEPGNIFYHADLCVRHVHEARYCGTRFRLESYSTAARMFDLFRSGA